MVVQILQWSFAGDDDLHEEAEHGEHGKAAVFQLLHLEFENVSGSSAKPNG